MRRVLDMGDDVFLTTVAAAVLFSLIVLSFLAWLKWSSTRKPKSKGRDRAAQDTPPERNNHGNERPQRRKKSRK